MFDPDPLKDRVIRNIVNADKRPQFDASIKYAKLAKVDTDPNIIEWINFRRHIGFFDNVPF